MSQLILEDIKKTFGKTKVLQSVNLKISSGLFGLLGKNGAGKTTLMRILATVLNPDSGRIYYGDIEWSKHADEVRRMIGYLPQEFGVFRNVTAMECLQYIAHLKGMTNKKTIAEEIEKILYEVNLEQVKDKKVGSFSGGMKRRLGIAQALLNDPQIVIVDEPTAGLDPEERIRFRSLLRQFGRNRIILLSTHIVEDIEATCHSVAGLKNGKAEQFSSLHDLASIAKNKVWLWRLTNEEYHQLHGNYQIISTKHNGDEVELRIIAHGAPSSDAVGVEPTIEEGYLIWNEQEDSHQS